MKYQRITKAEEEMLKLLWTKLEPRFRVHIIAPHYKGHKDVTFQLFHTDMPEEEAKSLMGAIDDPYVLSQVEETFTAREVAQLRDFFSDWDPRPKFCVRRASAPEASRIGVGALPVGGPTDFYMFSKMNSYPLPFKVWGYYDLTDSEVLEETLVKSLRSTYEFDPSSVEIYTDNRPDSFNIKQSFKVA